MRVMGLFCFGYSRVMQMDFMRHFSGGFAVFGGGGLSRVLYGARAWEGEA